MRAPVASLAVDAGFEELGVDAFYDPPGGADAVACVVTLSRPDRSVEFGGMQTRVASMIVKVRASEVAEPVKGGVFSSPAPDFAGQSLRIFAVPRRDDPARLVWTCECEPV